MPPRNGVAPRLSVSDLERMIRGRQRELNKLQKRRAKVQRKLDALDEKIASISGGRRAAGSSRARNGTNLPDTIAKVLARARGPMSVGEIAERALAGGYRTNSGNFRAVVNVALAKDKRFVSAGRGVYRRKGSGGRSARLFDPQAGR
jgi:hypothetical protein